MSGMTHVQPGVASEKGASPNIVRALARIYVNDLDAALPFYVGLSGGAVPQRFEFRHLRLARVAAFLLIEGADAEIRAHAATIAVRDLGPVVDAVVRAGGELLEGPTAGPKGARLIARHPDGSIVEYIQTR